MGARRRSLFWQFATIAGLLIAALVVAVGLLYFVGLDFRS